MILKFSVCFCELEAPTGKMVYHLVSTYNKQNALFWALQSIPSEVFRVRAFCFSSARQRLERARYVDKSKQKKQAH